MIYTLTYEKGQNPNRRYLLNLIACALCILMCMALKAQNTLIGLTSNGGINGKGTAFSLKTNGNNFSVINGFNDWGNTANGSLFKNDDGNFYGMTSKGGTYNMGTIFMIIPTGEITILRQLNYNTDGAYPDGELIKGPDGYLYGLTSAGGANSYGTIFKISTSGDFSVIKHFNFSADGADPHGHLIFASDGNFYGITYSGGANGAGTIFKLTTDGQYSVIHAMNKTTEGGNSYSSLTEGKDGYLYGTTYGGGTFTYGTIFKVSKDGQLTVLKQLNTADGIYPQSDLTQAKDGNFYGTCYGGGQFNNGVIFKITTDAKYSVVKNLSNVADGGYPYGSLMQHTDGNFYGITRTGGSKGGGTIYKLTKDGVYSIVHPLDYNNEGNTSSSNLVAGNDGSLYAMTSLGGPYNFGIIFKTTTAGLFTILNSFNGSSPLGNTPYSSFVKGKDSAYYCTTSAGGVYGYGSIVKICGGKATSIFSFNKAVHGGYPKGDLLLASDGNFYGMTSDGGPKSVGTIFRITPEGVFNIVYNFNSTTDGASPRGGLIQAKDGFLYGMTNGGGTNNAGTIFKMNLSGSIFTVLRNFVFATDGGAPNGNLVQASDSNFYGMTSNGGHIFKLTTAGVYSNVHTFNSSTDGYNALGSLIQADDGNLYGTCSDGGSNSAGTIFRIALDGNFKVVRNLNSTTDGRMPKGSLLQGPDGMLYGTTSIGGLYNTGTIFQISAGGSYSVLHHMNIATDGGNALGSLIFGAVNNLIADTKDVSVNEDTSVKITLTGSGGSPLTYTVVNNPGHGKLSGTGNKLTYKPNKNYNGADQFSYIVEVGCMASSSAVVNITVQPMPDTPVLSPIGDKTVIKDSTLKFKAKATDADKDQTLTYSLLNAPAGAKINKTTGAFTWTPTTTGKFTFKVRVTDNDTPALWDQEQITVTVTNSLTATIAENAKSATVTRASIYPNPAKDVLHINLSAASEKLTIRIVDLKGTIIQVSNFNDALRTNYNVDISKLKSGMYIVQLSSTTVNETMKFIKE